MKLHHFCAGAAVSAALSPVVLIAGSAVGAGLCVAAACTLAGVAWGLAYAQDGRASAAAIETPVPDMTQDDDVQRSVSQLGERLSLQFCELDDELTQIRGIIASATNNLSGSLTDLESASTGQTKLLRDMVDELVSIVHGPELDEQSRELKEFAEESQAVVRRLLDAMEAGESTLGEESQHALAEMTDHIRAVNDRVVGKWRTIIEVSDRIREHVHTGIVSLQFEDLAGQLIEHVRRRQSAMHEAFEKWNAVVGTYRDAEALHDALQTLEAEFAVRFDGLSRKSVNQTSVATGSVDLF